MIPIPEDYVVQNFYQCVQHSSYNKHTKVYNGSCPFCKEGDSWGRKQRFFYIPRKELAYCHNCGYSKKVLKFLIDLTGKSFNSIIDELKSLEYEDTPLKPIATKIIVKSPSLPDDCINLSDKTQLKFHESSAVVQVCLKFIKQRRLDTAINRPKTYYISLTDFIHKNRLVIPFYDLMGNIIFYQTRAILKGDLLSDVRYISKSGGVKSLAGIENVSSSLDHIFFTEGPIDSYFIENGLALAGIQDESDRCFGEFQRNQLAALSSFKKVWCLDNQRLDKAAFKKTESLIDQGESVFIWPKDNSHKDFNDICIANESDKIDPEFVLENTWGNLSAKIKLAEIKP